MGVFKMDKDQGFLKRAGELVAAGCELHAQGWVPATSGNFSARVDDKSIAITVSGRHKGRLTSDDIMLIDYEGQSLDGKKPSAETALHTQIYKHFPNANVVLHPHSPAATAISRKLNSRLVLENYELLKALAGIKTHAIKVGIPIFQNDQDIPRLAEEVAAYIKEYPDLKGYLIAGHGFYTWGETADDALRHVEALEFLFDQELRSLRISAP
jgi:methylthioribulose-1-phosphate dehydratase